MPRQKSSIICPICNEHGGTIGRRPVSISVQLPKLARIMKIEQSQEHSGNYNTMKLSDSFDFAAKIYLKLERRRILFPPISQEDDDAFAREVYLGVKPFDPHTDTERKLFETRWFNEHSIESRIIKGEENTAKNDSKRLCDTNVQKQQNGTALGYVPLKRRRRRTPKADKMHISKASIGLHYAAILFTALSNLVIEAAYP